MDRDPFGMIIEMFDSRRRAGERIPYRIGKISGLSPLSVDVAGTKQTGNILCNAELLKGAERKITLTNDYGSAGYDMKTTTDALSVGDKVLLLSADDQLFIIICKVV